jgi:hypothetical protein
MRICQVQYKASNQAVVGLGTGKYTVIGQNTQPNFGIGKVASIEFDRDMQCVLIRKVDLDGKPSRFQPHGNVGPMTQPFDTSAVPVANVECFGIVDEAEPAKVTTVAVEDIDKPARPVQQQGQRR